MWSVDRLLTWGKDGVAELHGDITDRPINGFSISTQTLNPGEIFIALKGTKQDGHHFVEQAFHKGAAGAMVSRAWFSEWRKAGQKNLFDPNLMGVRPLRIVVDDPLVSLQSLASFHRNSFQCPIIGITGSNGKTTTKEMLAKILGMRGPILKTEGNLNNQIGVPLSLLRLKKEDQLAVLEMGISGPGDMRLLCDIAKPTIGIITNIGYAHLDRLGTIQGVAAEKQVLFEAMTPNGIAIINNDDPYLSQWKGVCSEKWTYSVDNDADLTATEIERHGNGLAFTLALNRNQKGGGGKMKVAIPLLGEHQVYNALAASAAALALGYEFDEIRSALQDISPMPLRGEIIKWNGATILLDAYNANPSSMQAALLTLAGVAPLAGTASVGQRKVAILGDMLELGSAAKSAHKELGRQVAENRIDRLIAVGQFCEIVACGALGKGMQKQAITTFKNLESLDLAHEIQSGDVVLIKGSRGMGMERLLNARGREKVTDH